MSEMSNVAKVQITKDPQACRRGFSHPTSNEKPSEGLQEEKTMIR